MKEVEVEDENGKIWLIYKGDSAWNQYRFLSKTGVAEIVLPTEMLLQGTLPTPCSIDFSEVPIESVRMSADVQTIVRRQIRLKDCVQCLTRNEASS